MKIKNLIPASIVCSAFLFFTSCSSDMASKPAQSSKAVQINKATQNDIEAKIENLIQKMTLEEKVGQMAQYSIRGLNEDKLGPIEQQIREGKVGSFLNLTVKNGAIVRNKLQKVAVEESRMHIPLIFGFDVIHGYRTMFPIPLGQSCSWNPQLSQKAASIAAMEASAGGQDWTFAPMVDIARDPRWGRIAEGFGEDPFLGSAFAAAHVRGFQGSDLASPLSLVACLKHYIAYGAAEAGREYNTCDMSLRTLKEIYMPPFKAGVKAGAATLMSGFNEVAGMPTSGDPYVLDEVLRKEWGFDGFVVSDYNSVQQLVNQGFAKDPGDAGAKAVTAGVEMFMESPLCIEQLQHLVKQGKVSEKIIDEAVRRILRIKFRAGLFDNPYIDPQLEEKVTLTRDSLEIARQMARESMVLLKNEGDLLPLKKKEIKTISIIGPLGDNKQDLMGTWSWSGDANNAVTVLEAVKQKLSPDAEVLYAKGCGFDSNSTDFQSAIEVALRSDVVILAVGESIEHNGEAHSRAFLDLPGEQEQLVKLIKAAQTPVIVVLFTGRPLTISWIAENIPAILVAWAPGVQGGNAIADVLFGDYNPSGKLTTTFPRTVGQIPIYYNHKNTGRPFDAKLHYSSKYIDVPWTPLYPFGYGLSYTKFEYSNIKLSDDKVKMGEPVTVTVDVKNTGDRSGEEIVQLYIRDLVASATRPVRELKGFEKISLKPGEKKTVTFTITNELLSFYNDKMEYVVEPGDFTVFVGPDSASGLEANFEVVENM
jgi:beta-glucosidase